MRRVGIPPVLRDFATGGPIAAIDLPGHGSSPQNAEAPATIEGYSRLISWVLNELGWERCVVHGNSMGATVALEVAAQGRDRVSALILTAPVLPFEMRRLGIPTARLIGSHVPILLYPKVRYGSIGHCGQVA